MRNGFFDYEMLQTQEAETALFFRQWVDDPSCIVCGKRAGQIIVKELTHRIDHKTHVTFCCFPCKELFELNPLAYKVVIEMNSSDKTVIAVTALIVAALLGILLSIVTGRHLTELKVQTAIAGGIDPMTASCLYNRSTNDPVCLINSLKNQ